MRFWDSSALVPLVIEEGRSRACRDLYRADPGITAWTFAALEVLGGCCRRRREGALQDDAFATARARLEVAARRWRFVPDTPPIREAAARGLLTYELKTADALQLAAALVWCEGRLSGRQFVAGDDKLLAAAAAEGFTTIRPA
ncbi:MAG TPA: PIN domain-containing protein [Planctomycetota bacterium]|nr:PIN domain-containing protein [Planctomycetota bacterium]